MHHLLDFFINIWLKFFFLFTPFFAITMFLTLTNGYSEKERHKMALQVTAAAGVLCFALYFFGRFVFDVFGITVDAFRVGAGALLFLSAVSLVQSKPAQANGEREQDIAVVPLAMPIIVGPATIGTLLVMGAEIATPAEKGAGFLALAVAIICIGTLLFLASVIERMLGRRGINILSKITGLILSAMAAQMMLSGIKNFFAT